MKINSFQLQDHNQKYIAKHRDRFDFLASQLTASGIDVTALLNRLGDFQVAIPSWALGAGGTRFARFSYAGEPASLEQKLDDVGVLHALTQTAGAISLHIPWDVPQDYKGIKERAADLNLVFDAVNSNTFQDQPNQEKSYKYGSLGHINKDIRDMAIAHNIEVAKVGEQLDSKSLTVWLADGASFLGKIIFNMH